MKIKELSFKGVELEVSAWPHLACDPQCRFGGRFGARVAEVEVCVKWRRELHGSDVNLTVRSGAPLIACMEIYQ